MTPDTIINLAKGRVKNSSGPDYEALFGIVIDEIFSDREWKFARAEINYIHSANLAEKTFNGDATELALNKISAIRYTTAFTLLGGIPYAINNSSNYLDFMPLQEFREAFPDNQLDGIPEWWTEVIANDGKSGMSIEIFRRPTSDAAVWVTGYFIPVYAFGATELPILPKQFHSMVIDGITGYAAESEGMRPLAVDNFNRFQLKLQKLRLYDSRNPAYKMQRGGRGGVGRLKLYLPGDFPLGVGK